MNMKKFSELTSTIDNHIYKSFTSTNDYQKKVYESMTYSLSSGGKRIRPILSVLTFKVFSDDDIEKILPFATAIEFIHTYSLIHDDLPSMDNDDLRRGKPTNHKVYSEAIAILAGDGLLNMSSEILARQLDTYTNMEDLKRAIRAMKYIFTQSGVHGMIGGQVIDIEYSDSLNLDICESMYKLKTAALIKAAIVSAGIVAGANDEEIAILEEFSNCIGIAYQMKDDILDAQLDLDKDNNTILKFKSKDEVIKRIDDLTNKAIEELNYLNRDTTELKNFALGLINRDK